MAYAINCDMIYYFVWDYYMPMALTELAIK